MIPKERQYPINEAAATGVSIVLTAASTGNVINAIRIFLLIVVELLR